MVIFSDFLKSGGLLSGKTKAWLGLNTPTEISLAGHTHSNYAASSHNHSASNITSGTLGTARGGTGITSNPSMLVNLGSTSASNVFATSPRPGVTGTLPLTRGGTGVTSLSALKSTLGISNLDTSSMFIKSERIGYWSADSSRFSLLDDKYYVYKTSFDYTKLDKYFSVLLTVKLNITTTDSTDLYIALGWRQANAANYDDADDYDDHMSSGTGFCVSDVTITGETTCSYLFNKIPGSLTNGRRFAIDSTNTDNCLYYPNYFDSYKSYQYQFPVLRVFNMGYPDAVGSFEIELLGLYF